MVRLILVLLAALFLGAPVMAQVNYALLIGASKYPNLDERNRLRGPATVVDLATRVGPGDFLYVHFSGHGSQAPELVAGSELDGVDELFLPTDIGPWDRSIGRVKTHWWMTISDR
jgi:hypothetical protein